ncbi:MAG: NAD(P)/FAD-dependent oxidoreductase [Thiotrichales bacterium]|nr:NAD(P)/FAD-dependent oxidoreductase [Thiotrichales bacterium]
MLLPSKPCLLLIGAGMAGTRFLDELLALGSDYQITVFNSEPFGGYNRIMLSPVLAKEKAIAEIMTHDAHWFAANGIDLHTDKSVIAIKRSQQQVITDSGEVFSYDKLIIATGSKPFILPIDNTHLPGVVSFRDIADVQKMQQVADGGKHAVVIGGGLLGLEAAYGLQKQGMQVSVVHRSEVLMNAQLDVEAGAMLQTELEAKALRFYMGNEVAEIVANADANHIQAVRLKDSRQLPCDLLVMAIGIRPNVELGIQATLEVNRGIVVNDQLLTEDANIYALGECVEHRGQTYGLVAPLYEQAKVLAQVLRGQTQAAYQGSLTSTKLKVTGINLFSAGNFNGGEGCQELIFRDPQANIYRKLVLQDNKVVGALLYGDTYDANWFFELLQNGTDITEMRDTVLFGQGFNSAA